MSDGTVRVLEHRVGRLEVNDDDKEARLRMLEAARWQYAGAAAVGAGVVAWLLNLLPIGR